MNFVRAENDLWLNLSGSKGGKKKKKESTNLSTNKS